ncbi:Retrotransposon-derived protein PEG10 [Tolypocladium ophioglossoides CBS 100239]|uniref:Retrotransposon-derived protein PEG10 n=1 Tax=Tolypocladium ophioglossoides (strain CBS 100239) TaxID=1163406 RepID=A0A0L0MYY7_TOLOC|nr:Retrotransposon-derived protein PEG10 [Tolypocladium ophioglossoides CBS 100239]
MSPGSSNTLCEDRRTSSPGANFTESHVRAAERNIWEICQKGSASSYARLFREIALPLSWDDPPLMAAFYNGLKDDVKDEMCMKDRPKTLEEYIAMAVAIDNRQYARHSEKQAAKTKEPPERKV